MAESATPRESLIAIDVEGTNQRVSGILLEPAEAWLLFVLAHGAGAGMRHPFMERVAAGLAAEGIATLRYQFPYMEQGRRRPDPAHLLEATARAAAVAAGAGPLAHLPRIAGGKSMGGRMTSRAQAESPLDGVLGLAFLGFPLHRRGEPDERRGEHLDAVSLPMLFVQGSRDELAVLDRLEPVCEALGERATLHVVDGADHGFEVLKRSGRTADEVLTEVIGAIGSWARGLEKARSI